MHAHIATAMEKAAPCGQSVGELNLRARTGVTIIAVVRSNTPHTNPPTDFVLQAGDVLVLVGAHAQLDKAKAILDERA